MGVLAQVQRVAPARVDAAQDHVHRLQPPRAAHRALPHPALAHGQLRRQHQREPQPGRQQRLLERGLATAGRGVSSTTRARSAAGASSSRPRRIASKNGPRRRIWASRRTAASTRADDPPVGQGVPGAGRGLHAVAEHPPALGGAHEVGAREEQLARARRGARPAVDVAGVAEHHLDGQQPGAQGEARAVEVGEQAVEQLRPLRDARLELGPRRRGERERQRVERPRLLVLAGRAVGDALVGQQPPGGGGEPRGRRAVEQRGELRPPLPDRAVGGEHLVVPRPG